MHNCFVKANALLPVVGLTAARGMQAGLAASQATLASYRQLRNETQLYAINMQFSGGQV